MHPNIIQALITGALALAQPGFRSTLGAAYQRLRTQLLTLQPSLQALLDLLERNANDEDTQQFAERQLRKAEIGEDGELLALAEGLRWQMETPTERVLGVAIGNVEVGGDVSIDDVSSSGDGVSLSESKVKGSVKLSAVQAGKQGSDSAGLGTLITGNTIGGDLILDPSRAALDAAERRYLAGLYRECNELTLANQGPVDSSRRKQPRLQHVYVDLETTSQPSLPLFAQRLGLQGNDPTKLLNTLRRFLPEQVRNISGERPADDLALHWRDPLRQLDDEKLGKVAQQLGVTSEILASSLGDLTLLEAIQFNRQLVLLGDPGGGKSTLTRRLAGVLASQGRSDLDGEEQRWLAELIEVFGGWLLPIHIPLSRWASHLPDAAEGKADEMIDECVRLIGQTADLPTLKPRLVKQLGSEKASVLLLLDGLDEVADESKRNLLLKSLRHFCECYGNTPMLITCRSSPWEAWKGQGEQLNLPVFTIGKLSDKAIQRFVERWHNELLGAGIYQPADAQLAQQRLFEAIRDPRRTDLADMAGTPLLLTMMARVNYERGLPDSRAELYEWYMRQLLWEWERSKLDEKGQPTSLEILLRAGNVDSASLERKLSQLAYEVHASRGDRDTVDIPRSTLREALETIHPGSDEATKAAWAVKMLALLDDRTGLLRSLDHKLYQFSHRTFQEYLAARWLATGDYRKKFKDKIDLEQWGEVISLALGYQSRVQKQYEDALTVLFNLFPKEAKTEADWRRVLLLGQAYVRLLGPQKARESEQSEIAASLIERIPSLLTDAMQNPALPAQQRLEAGLLLTRSVDDPVGAGLDVDPLQLDHFIEIPGAGMRIGKYPVTNKQYKCFINDAGYDTQPWWSKEGWDERQKQGWVLPRFWNNAQYNRLSQPVVGVSWYEANAYCAWLSEQLRQAGTITKRAIVRLPTEQEWMRAAHADQYVYPWGDEFDSRRANTSEGGIQETTPVHMYKNGVTSEDVYDLSGNVWEWCDDKENNKYPYLKGGLDEKNARSSARDVNYPNLRYHFNGFRCVVVPSSR